MKNTEQLIIKKRKFSLETLCAYVVIALVYFPLINIDRIGTYVYDTAIQIKIGLDSIEQHRLILKDIYSWHVGLNWIPHETAWYILVGGMYKILGLAGVILLTAILIYSMAVIIYRNLSSRCHTLVFFLSMAIGIYFSFPDINARPHLVSQLLMVIFSFTMLDKNKSSLRKISCFIVCAFLMSWFHGGMIPIFFVMYMVYLIIELIYREFSVVKVYSIGLFIGFVASLLNPTGINVWTYGLIQTKATDLWNIISGWQPATFSIFGMTLILLILIGFGVDERLHNFDKDTVIRLCFICMFLIASCKYVRFMTYFALFVFMFGAEEIEVLIKWLTKNVLKLREKEVKITNFSYGLISCLALVGLVYMFISKISFFPTNSLDDCAAIMAYDKNVVDVVKEKGYSNVFNSFNTGTFFAFYDIPVHIDNRSDLYMSEYSGEDHTRGEMYMENIDSMNRFVNRYNDVGAFIMEFDPRDPATNQLVKDVSESDRFSIVYDNTVVSNTDLNKAYRWFVIEVN
ncbi:MAG: hypothetical protein MJ153_03995 [Clostridia bacterium]|nr:hypothetical protein [Clostridia bacterium]